MSRELPTTATGESDSGRTLTCRRSLSRAKEETAAAVAWESDVAGGSATTSATRSFGGTFASLLRLRAALVSSLITAMSRSAAGSILSSCDFGFDALQLADDPAVDVGKLDRRALVEAAVLARGVHQDEAGRVPQLVAEIAVALAAAQVEAERAREARQRGEREAQRVGAERRDAARKMRADVSLDLLPVLALQQPHRGFFQQLVEADAVDEIDRGDRVALRLRHLLALGVAHDGVDVDVAERHLAGEVPGHHHHARHPEADDVLARHQHRGGQEHFQVFGLFRPA